MPVFAPGPHETHTWTLPVWDVIFDRLTSGKVTSPHLNMGSGKPLSHRTAKQQIDWATKLDLSSLNQKTIDKILNRFFGFSAGTQYLEESKIHVLHQLGEKHAPLHKKVEGWLSKRETRDEFHSRIEFYSSYRDAMDNLEKVMIWPRAIDSLPFKTNITYDVAVKCSGCFQFLCKKKLASIEGYDLSGRNWLEAAFVGENTELLTYLATNMDPRDMIKPRDIKINDQAETHILIAFLRYNAYEAFEIALDRMTDDWTVKSDKLKEIFDPATMSELCAIAPPSVAKALYSKGINIGNVECEDHPVGAQLESSWHMAAAFNPEALAMVKWLDKFSTLTPNVRNNYNQTPLMYAANFEQPGAIAWLCENSDLTLSRFEDGPPGYALLCAAESCFENSVEIFSIILDKMPKQIMSIEYGKTCGTQIAAGLVRHRENLSTGQVKAPGLREVERQQVYKMQALVRRLPSNWPGSTWHLALEAYANDNGVGVLKHSMGTETRRTRSNSTRRRRAMRVTREALGIEDEDDHYNSAASGNSSLSYSTTSTLYPRHHSKNRYASRSRSRGRQGILSKSRDAGNRISKMLRWR
ncbi:hypothetical protein MYU51_014259 [Penicillium brevicompactum]|uniref:uncharacterized protein n=1 Tax=Penicillium brevicompactum TaxID=5074 RepID=UPI0025422D16|nr:uncharacterized protein N7506_007180 [Penicillium brevicompactum]KAJ5333397.1 hypothetical protein N7506_007180 [Penicillium brevicompactum]